MIILLPKLPQKWDKAFSNQKIVHFLDVYEPTRSFARLLCIGHFKVLFGLFGIKTRLRWNWTYNLNFNEVGETLDKKLISWKLLEPKILSKNIKRWSTKVTRLVETSKFYFKSPEELAIARSTGCCPTIFIVQPFGSCSIQIKNQVSSNRQLQTLF